MSSRAVEVYILERRGWVRPSRMMSVPVGGGIVAGGRDTMWLET